MSTTFREHRRRWAPCNACPIARPVKVFGRGRIPCDVLFVGEAPGYSENSIGIPFVGPAGKLLDRLIYDSCEAAGWKPRIFITNLVLCMPDKPAFGPPSQAIHACGERLAELKAIVRPRAIIAVGSIAAAHCNADISIEHPASILRKPEAQRCYSIWKATAAISNLFGKVRMRTA